MSKQRWIWLAEHVIPSQPEAGKQIVDEVLDQLRRESWAEQDVFGVHLALEEALVNAIKHGNRHDSTKQVRVTCKLAAERLRIEISDEGPGFNPSSVPDCTEEENLHRASGRGIMLMRNFMSRVEYHEPGNRVVMEKDRDATPPALGGPKKG